MTIENGFKAVHKILFGVEPGKIKPCGICSRCKEPLIINVIDGNAQSNHKFKFSTANGLYQGFGILNGLWAKLEWEADLCNGCLNSLSDWLLGENWRYKDAVTCKECGGEIKRIVEGEYACSVCNSKCRGWIGSLEKDN